MVVLVKRPKERPGVFDLRLSERLLHDFRRHKGLDEDLRRRFVIRLRGLHLVVKKAYESMGAASLAWQIEGGDAQMSKSARRLEARNGAIDYSRFFEPAELIN